MLNGAVRGKHRLEKHFWLISDGFLDTVVKQTLYYSLRTLKAGKKDGERWREKKPNYWKKKVYLELLLPSKPDIHLASAAAHNAGRECSISHSLLQHPRLLLQPAPGIAGGWERKSPALKFHPWARSCILCTPKSSKNNGILGCAGNAEVSWHLLAADGLH